MKWFSVKTLYRWSETVPASDTTTKNENPILLEERVVLFKARSIESAIKKAEKEAEAYSTVLVKNSYGHDIQVQYLGCCEAFEMFDNPEDGKEIYSQTNIYPSSLKKEDAIELRFGPELNKEEEAILRRKFEDGKFSRSTQK